MSASAFPWELQWHSANAVRPVRRFSITRARKRGLIALAVILGLYLAIGLALSVRLALDLARGAATPPPAPLRAHEEAAAGSAFDALFGRRLRRAARAEAQLEERRLGALLARLDELTPRARSLRFDVQRLASAYGVDSPAPPLPAAPPPAGAADRPARIARGKVQLGGIAEELRAAAAYLEAAERFQQAEPARVAVVPTVRPLPADSFVLTSPFGERRNPFTQGLEMHAGIDLAAPEGTPVLATADGVVTFADSLPARPGPGWWRFGKLVAVRHGDAFLTIYGHLSEIAVRPGQRVRRGERLGAVGNTGWSMSPHLHYEVRQRIRGALVPRDPRLFILDEPWGDPEALTAELSAAPRMDGFEEVPSSMAF